MSRPVLVTGASGFLGATLLGVLAGALRRPAVGTYWANPIEVPRADAALVDLRDGRAADRLLRDLRPSAVIHCAALTDTGACERDPAGARAAIVDATRHLVAAARAHVPSAPFVALSTDLVFDGRGAPYAPGDGAKPLSAYGGLKHEAESPVLAHPGGAVVRASLMAGPPTRWKSGFLGWMRSALAEGRPSRLFADEFRSVVPVVDLAHALVALADRRAEGLFHAGGERLDRLRMGRILCEEGGFDPGLLVPSRRAEADGPPRPADVSLVSAAFWAAAGIRPRPFRQAVREALAAEEPTKAPMP